MNHFRKLGFVTRTPLASLLAMMLLLSALVYAACDVQSAKDDDSKKDSDLALAVLLMAVYGPQPFPVTGGNVFSIQYRNSTTVPITVWLEGSQPPCSKTAAESGKCNVSGSNATNYNTYWETTWKDDHSFSDSGTHFYKISKAGVSSVTEISNHIVLQPGETLRIVPPINGGGKPEWYWSNGVTAATAGVKGWVTRAKTAGGADISMPASEKTLLYEYNVSPDGKVYWDLSAVDGLNAKATMTYEGAGCGSDSQCGCGVALPKVCKSNIDAYNGSNDGCPYVMQFDSANVCPNPKFYPASIDASVIKPAWVIGTSSFSNEKVSSEHATIYSDAGSPSGFKMADAGVPGEDTPEHRAETIKLKKAYHIWWSTNPVGQGWLYYLQHNAAGKCDAYGWAFDEKKWISGDETFDPDGNPPDNPLQTNVTCTILSNTYLNIDILDIM